MHIYFYHLKKACNKNSTKNLFLENSAIAIGR